MITLKSLTIVAAVLAVGASLSMAQNGLPSPGIIRSFAIY